MYSEKPLLPSCAHESLSPLFVPPRAVSLFRVARHSYLLLLLMFLHRPGWWDARSMINGHKIKLHVRIEILTELRTVSTSSRDHDSSRDRLLRPEQTQENEIRLPHLILQFHESRA